MKYYMAYGSNLNLEQMRRRCPDAMPVSLVELKGWRLACRTYLDIERGAKNDRVVGGLFLISERDEAALDRYEGLGSSGRYRKVWFDMKFNGAMEQVLIYLMSDQTHHWPCSHAYYDCVAAGFRDWGIDLQPLKDACAEAFDEARLCWIDRRPANVEEMAY